MSKEAFDYTIVTSNSYTDLSTKVYIHLTKGWQPIGGVSFDGERYLQAIVKYYK